MPTQIIPNDQVLLVSATLTRPADAVAYAVSDVVANAIAAAVVMTFARSDASAAIYSAAGRIKKARLVTNQAANVAAFRLHLYSIPTTTTGSDNAPFTLSWADRATHQGSIDFPMCATEGAGSDCAEAICNGLDVGYLTGLGSGVLYGVLETKTIFTPASGQQFFIELTLDQE